MISIKKQTLSQEQILSAASDLFAEQGFSNLSIRAVAAQCGVSVGSIYNYFPAKSDLLFALAENFWENVCRESVCPLLVPDSFVEFFGRLYESLHEKLGEFESGLLEEFSTMDKQERDAGKKRENEQLEQIKHGMLGALKRDCQISPDLWTDTFTPEAFVQFAFDNLMSALRNGQDGCPFLLEVLKKIIYQKGES